MAFVTKTKNGCQVRHGVTGQRLHSYNNCDQARRKRDKLHKENKPKRKNRGRTARRRYQKRQMRR